jgi:sterol desaturase/sphingolipid hydroxylase (fatty acid hydroxylase superfamily)
MSPKCRLPNKSARLAERLVVGAVLVLFGGFTLAALAMDGVIGIVHAITYNWMSVQIFVDLVLAVVAIDTWIYRDARSRGKHPWPWVIASLVTGMCAPLVYFLARERNVLGAGERQHD